MTHTMLARLRRLNGQIKFATPLDEGDGPVVSDKVDVSGTDANAPEDGDDTKAQMDQLCELCTKCAEMCSKLRDSMDD